MSKLCDTFAAIGYSGYAYDYTALCSSIHDTVYDELLLSLSFSAHYTTNLPA